MRVGNRDAAEKGGAVRLPRMTRFKLDGQAADGYSAHMYMGIDPIMGVNGKSQIALIADRYEIRAAFGSGGAGAVFKAWDTQLHRFVAVKRWNAPEPMLDDPEGTERLWREAMTLAAIQHPNILTIHDFGVDDEGPVRHHRVRGRRDAGPRRRARPVRPRRPSPTRRSRRWRR